MIQLHPKETFTIVRQIEDHTDSGTYYVQAVVRNAKTDVLLDTINLDDKGDRRFSKSYIVPADPSGEGVWISILTSVYTDSGYTTKSQGYADKMESYLVQARPVFNPNYPIPTGPDIDYKRIKAIVEEEITKARPKEVDLSDVINSVKQVQGQVTVVKNIINSQKPTDISPISNSLDGVSSLIKAIKIPEFDYSKIDEIISFAMENFSAELIRKIDNLPKITDDQREEIKKMFGDSFNGVIERYKKSEQMESKFKELIEIIGGEADLKKKAEEDQMMVDKKERITRLIKTK